LINAPILPPGSVSFLHKIPIAKAALIKKKIKFSSYEYKEIQSEAVAKSYK
jgi:hypothetical protein